MFLRLPVLVVAQAVFCLFPDNLEVGAIFYNSLTFGLGQLCLSPEMQRITAKTLLITQPLLLYTLLFVMGLTREKAVGIWMNDLLFNFKGAGESVKGVPDTVVPRVLWLCILYSSSVLAYVALTLITCVPLEDASNHSINVLFVDGSVRCFLGMHVPYAITAILILIIFIIPPQTFLFTAPFVSFKSEFLNRFYAQAKQIYRDGCLWWGAVSLLRRLTFAILLTVVTDGSARRFSMTCMSLVLLAAHATYKYVKGNKN